MILQPLTLKYKNALNDADNTVRDPGHAYMDDLKPSHDSMIFLFF